LQRELLSRRREQHTHHISACVKKRGGVECVCFSVVFVFSSVCRRGGVESVRLRVSRFGGDVQKEQTRKVARVAMHAKSLTKGAYFFLEGRGRPLF
jgi:hypothetical protein